MKDEQILKLLKSMQTKPGHEFDFVGFARLVIAAHVIERQRIAESLETEPGSTPPTWTFKTKHALVSSAKVAQGILRFVVRPSMNPPPFGVDPADNHIRVLQQLWRSPSGGEPWWEDVPLEREEG